MGNYKFLCCVIWDIDTTNVLLSKQEENTIRGSCRPGRDVFRDNFVLEAV